MTAFTQALIARDIAAALALVTDDVVFFYSNGTVLRGKEAFAATMTANWKLVSEYQYTTVDLAWTAQSDTAAAVIYSFSWSGMANGNAVSGSGRGTRVLRREPVRWLRRRPGWRIAHEHLSNGQW